MTSDTGTFYPLGIVGKLDMVHVWNTLEKIDPIPRISQIF